jgi:ribosomal protein L39E
MAKTGEMESKEKMAKMDKTELPAWQVIIYNFNQNSITAVKI